MKKSLSRYWTHLIRGNFACTADWGIPIINSVVNDLSTIKTIPCDKVIIGEKQIRPEIVHFFVDDSKLNRYFNNPERYVDRFSYFRAVMTPDFSLYKEMPLPVQLYNTFKNRYCGALWESYGIPIIPTISWCDRNSYKFCFEGIPRQSVVAISSVGVQLFNRRSFEDGYQAMQEVIEPSLVIHVGEPIIKIFDNTIPVQHRQFKKEK